MRKLTLVLFILAQLFVASAWAAIDAYSFPNEQLRDRYHTLIDELRCPQCLNTNIAGSDSMISKDLRREVHRMLLEGKTNDEILEFMHQRYGDFILYKPRVKASTYVLWFGPLVLLIIAGIVAVRLVADRKKKGPAALSESEEERLNRLLHNK